MMAITASDVAAFVACLSAGAAREEQTLNAADARLGDGDTGSMLRRVFAAMATANAAGAATVSEAGKRLAAAAMKETGSSLGTLVATGAMTFAREAREIEGAGRDPEPADLPRIVAAMRDAISMRGKAEPGDKTILDSLYAIAAALGGGEVSREVAAQAAQQALAAFRDRPCRIGRARMFPERSIGADDPGMLAAALLLA